LSFKSSIRPFVPPIIWTALSRSKKKPKARNTGPKRSVTDIVAGENFTVQFSKVTQDRGVYFVPKYADHRPASRAVLNGDVHEPDTHELIDRIMQRKPGSMIHAGTFFGDMLPTFSRSCPGTVYAFEPVLENYVLAKLCIETNKLENVYLQNAALSESTSIAHIDTGNEGQEHRGGSSELSDAGQLVGLLTIDSLGIDDIVVIQLDVEGLELPALRGARATIERNAPIVMVEDNLRTCNAFLKELGYSHIRTIPGLFIWCRPAERELVEDLLPVS
jgi:FkbM family methyltransferase